MSSTMELKQVTRSGPASMRQRRDLTHGDGSREWRFRNSHRSRHLYSQPVSLRQLSCDPPEGFASLFEVLPPHSTNELCYYFLSSVLCQTTPNMFSNFCEFIPELR